MSTTIKHIILTLHILAFSALLFGQSKVIVVTRTVKQSWNINTSATIFLNAEKAKIIIEKSSSASVEVQLKLRSKHSDIAIARKELQYLKYNLDKKGKDIYINNSILIPSNKPQPESRLSAEYLISIPENCHIQIKNSLGDVYLKNLNNTVDAELKYGNLSLMNTKGEININISIGDMTLNNINGKVNIISEYSEIKLKNINGEYMLKSKYGELSVIPGYDMEILSVESNKTDVTLFNEQCHEYILDIETQYGDLRLTTGCYLKDKNNLEKQLKKDKIIEIKYKSLEKLPIITIRSKFAAINLR